MASFLLSFPPGSLHPHSLFSHQFLHSFFQCLGLGDGWSRGLSDSGLCPLGSSKLRSLLQRSIISALEQGAGAGVEHTVDTVGLACFTKDDFSEKVAFKPGPGLPWWSSG